MIDQRAISVFKTLFMEQVVERRDSLGKQIQSIKERAAARGTLHSGMTVSAITEVCSAELKIRTQLAWDQLQQVLSKVGIQISPEIQRDIREVMHWAIDAQADEIFNVYRSSASGLQVAWQPDAVDQQRQRLTHSIDARIDLFAMEIESRTATSNGIVNNFYGGNIGSVVSGSGASSLVTQNIGNADQQSILRALDAVEAALHLASDIADDTRRELRDVISEVRQELAKRSPNRLRLTQLASGVAITIQTAASLQPAYNLLKGALIGAGLLPG